MGYDSIQIPYKSEIVICSGKCSEVMFQLTCPPLEWKVGLNGMTPCRCNGDIPILNCRPIDINRPINSYYLGYRYEYLNVGASYPYSYSYYIDKSINKYYKPVSCIQ